MNCLVFRRRLYVAPYDGDSALRAHREKCEPCSRWYARHLSGERAADRQRFRDELLGTTAGDFRACADVLEPVQEKGSVVVLGSQAAIEEANAERGHRIEVTQVL